MIYETMTWQEIQISELNMALLISSFLKDPKQTLYVVDKEGALDGIITLGNFRRHEMKGTPLIQRQFTFVTEQEENLVEELMIKNSKISSVPVLDSTRHIIKEYRKLNVETGEGHLSARRIIGLYQQFLPTTGKNLLIMSFEDDVQRNAAQKIMQKTSGALTIVNESDVKDFDAFLRDADYQICFDCIPEHICIREILYKKYGLTYSVVQRRYLREEMEALHDFLLHYKTMAILTSEADYFKPLFDSAQRISLLDESRFRWRDDHECYEYMDDISELPEALCVSCCLLKNPCIICNNRIIPVISREYPMSRQYVNHDAFLTGAYAADYDLACNIIPKLQQNHINVIVISNMGMEQNQPEAFDSQEAAMRAKRMQSGELDTIRKEFCNRWGNDEIEFFIEDCKNLQWCNKNGYLQIADYRGKYINICNGERLTLDNPAGSSHTLWLFGPCLFWGQYTDDACSLGSLLRKKVDKTYAIRNIVSNWRERHVLVRDVGIRCGDTVVIYAFDAGIYQKAGYDVHSLFSAYQKCPNLMRHVIDGPNHINWYMTAQIADRIYEIISNQSMPACGSTDTLSVQKIVSFGISKTGVQIPEQLTEWLENLKKRKDLLSNNTGAIVMNCNPFTLGHRYLIETACAKVDRLLVFVVEEDKSFFKFEDRLHMVKIGTKDLPNVTVVPSGRYIISAETLPGYFEKDDNPDVLLDAASDLHLFADVIAKELHIKIRFVGEEPIDRFTRQYNQAMRQILPDCGVHFMEIPRKEWNGKVISASRVRKLMEEKEYEKVKELVMPQIYAYLAEHYF